MVVSGLGGWGWLRGGGGRSPSGLIPRAVATTPRPGTIDSTRCLDGCRDLRRATSWRTTHLGVDLRRAARWRPPTHRMSGAAKMPTTRHSPRSPCQPRWTSSLTYSERSVITNRSLPASSTVSSAPFDRSWSPTTMRSGTTPAPATQRLVTMTPAASMNSCSSWHAVRPPCSWRTSTTSLWGRRPLPCRTWPSPPSRAPQRAPASRSSRRCRPGWDLASKLHPMDRSS